MAVSIGCAVMTSADAPSSQVYFNTSMTTADSRDLSQFTYTTQMKFNRFFYSGQPDDFNLTTPAGSVFCHCLNVIIITFSGDLSLSHAFDH